MPSSLEAGMFVLIVGVIAGLRWMPVARLVRAQFLSLREKEFAQASRALGASTLHLVVRHLVPNSLGPVIVAGSVDVAAAILAESSNKSVPAWLPMSNKGFAASCAARAVSPADLARLMGS